MSKFNDYLSKMRWSLLQDERSVFFASLALNLNHVEDNTMPTAYTTGKTVGYNIDFLEKLTPKQRVGLLLHEVLHVAFKHTHIFPFSIETATERQCKLWNVACDYVINLIIIDAGFELPPGGLLDEKYRDMSAVAVYNRLIADDPANDPDTFDEMKFNKPAKEGDSGSDGATNGGQVTEREIEIIINAAKQQAIASGPKAVGAIPGEIQRMLENSAVPKVPWHILMRRFYSSNVARKLNYRKLNRRFLPKIKLPTKSSKGIKKAVTFFDVSGSISEAELKKCASETVRMLQIPEIKSIEAYQFDTRITTTPSVLKSQQDVIGFNLVGGGGTNLQWLPEWCRQNKPDFIIVFTDGYFHEIREKINVPILWIIFDNLNFTACKQGKVIYYDKD